MAEAIRVWAEPLKAFCERVFQKLGVSEEDARITADVLVAADLRGIDSHGVARLRRYVEGLQTGVMVARPQEQVVRETPATGIL
jgi:malate dehydrogenase (NAD) (EC 1.1.1.37)